MSNHDLDEVLAQLERAIIDVERAHFELPEVELEARVNLHRALEVMCEILTHRAALGAKSHWTPSSAHQLSPLPLMRLVSSAFRAQFKAQLLDDVPRVHFSTVEDACSLFAMSSPAPVSFEEHALQLAQTALQDAYWMTLPCDRWPRDTGFIYKRAKHCELAHELKNLVNHYQNVSHRWELPHVEGTAPAAAAAAAAPAPEATLKRSRVWECENCHTANEWYKISCKGCWYVFEASCNKKFKK